MRFTVTATIEYAVDIDGDVAEELVAYCHEHNCDLDEALWHKQTKDLDFNLYDDVNCEVSESDFSTESIEYEGMSDYDDVYDFITDTADDYDIPKSKVADIIGEEWRDEDDVDSEGIEDDD